METKHSYKMYKNGRKLVFAAVLGTTFISTNLAASADNTATSAVTNSPAMVDKDDKASSAAEGQTQATAVSTSAAMQSVAPISTSQSTTGMVSNAQPVSDTTQAPYAAIVKIKADTGDIPGVGLQDGTGVLIAPDTILTAAHNVYYDTNAGFAHTAALPKSGSQVQVLPAYRGASAAADKQNPFGEGYYADKIYIYNDYLRAQGYTSGDADMQNRFAQNDLAIIKLNKPVTNAQATPLKLATANNVSDQYQTLGYPTDLSTTNGQSMANSDGNMYVSQGTATVTDGRLVSNNINVGNGGSAPLLNGTGQVVGILSSVANGISSWTMLDNDKIQWINQHISQAPDDNLTYENARNQWKQVDGQWIKFDQNARVEYQSTGWQTINGGLYYLEPANSSAWQTGVPGQVKRSGTLIKDGLVYLFANDGRASVAPDGWYNINGQSVQVLNGRQTTRFNLVG